MCLSCFTRLKLYRHLQAIYHKINTTYSFLCREVSVWNKFSEIPHSRTFKMCLLTRFVPSWTIRTLPSTRSDRRHQNDLVFTPFWFFKNTQIVKLQIWDDANFVGLHVSQTSSSPICYVSITLFSALEPNPLKTLKNSRRFPRPWKPWSSNMNYRSVKNWPVKR